MSDFRKEPNTLELGINYTIIYSSSAAAQISSLFVKAEKILGQNQDLNREFHSIIQKAIRGISSLELNAFYYMVGQYFSGHKTGEELTQFIESCFNPSLEKENYLISIPDHAVELLNLICQIIVFNSQHHSAKTNWGKIDVNSTDSIQRFLKQFSQNAEFYHNVNKSFSEICDDGITMMKFLRSPRIFEVRIAREFAAWIMSNANIPSHAAVRIRPIVNKVAYRLSKFKFMQEQITQMLEMNSIAISQPPTLLAIAASPFYRVADRRYHLVQHFIKSVETDNNFVEDIRPIIESIVKFTIRFQERFGHLYQDVRSNIEFLQSQIIQHESELEILMQDLLPYSQSVFSVKDRNIQFIPCSALDEAISKFSNRFNGQPDKQETITDIAQQIVQFWQTAEENAKKIDTARHHISMIDSIIYTVISNIPKDDPQIQQSEVFALNEFESSLNKLHQALTKRGGFISFEKVEQVIHQNILIQNQMKENFDKMKSEIMSDLNGDQSIEQITKDIDSLKAEIEEMTDNLAQTRARLDEEEEVKISDQPVEVKANSGSEHRCFDRTMPKLLKRIMCPICKHNRRNVIISKCGHPVCSSCLAREKEQVCPICKRIYTDDDVKPFIMLSSNTQ